MATEPTYRLEGVIRTREEMQDFEGPLNLILMLLSKNKIEIRDIQISLILDQYLAFIEGMQELDLEVASEFVQMASNLLYIKTRMLLTGEEEVSELELLMTSLEQLKARDAYAAVRAVVPEIGRMSERGRSLWSTPGETLPKYGAYECRHEPVELLGALYGLFSRGIRSPEEEEEQARVSRLIPRRITYPVTEKSRQLVERMRRKGSEKLSSLYQLCESRSELVATFISLLELCSVGSLYVSREDGELIVNFAGGGRDTESILRSLSFSETPSEE